MPTSSKITCGMENNMKLNLQQPTNHVDSNIEDKEQVIDLSKMMSNTATFNLHIRNIVKKARDNRGCC